MNRYEEYKKVDILCLNEIPSHWNVFRLKKIASFITGNSIKDEEKSKYTDNNNSRIYVSTSDIDFTTMRIRHKSRIFISLSDKNFKIASKGSTLVCVEGGNGGKKIAFSSEDVCFGNKLCAIKSYKEYDKFIYYIFMSNIFKNQFFLHINGDRNGVSMTNLGRFYFALPPIKEQKQIADYLDWKINEIDKLIHIEKEKIKELGKLKKSMIKNFVLKGLKKYSKFIDTKIDWINEIPDKWRIEKLTKYVKIIRGNSMFTKDDLLSNGDYVALQYGKTYKVDRIDDKFNFYVNNEYYKYSQIVEKDDIILISTSETIEDLGHVVFYETERIGLIGGEQILLKPQNIYSEYLYYLITIFSRELQKFSTGIKVFRFNKTHLKNIFIPIPPIQEQKEIVNYINKKTYIMSNEINLRNDKIIELNKLKQSLISEVVTGQIDVRGVVIPEYDKLDTVEEDMEDGVEEMESE